MAEKHGNKAFSRKEEKKSTGISHGHAPHEETRYLDAFVSALPIMAYSIDQEGVIQNVSDLWLTKMGYEWSEVIGRKATDFFAPKSKKCAEVDGLPGFVLVQFVENKECRLLTKDGTVIDVLLSAKAWSDKELCDNCYVATMCDVTQHKKAQDALEKSEKRYRSAQKIGKVGHWEFDLKTNTFWGSDEAKRIYGSSSNEDNFSVDDIEKCIPERQRVHQALVDLIKKGRPYKLEFMIHPLNGGAPKYIKSMAEIVVDEAGVPEKIDGVILDITDIKLADEKLKKGEAKYRQLFDSIRDIIVVTNSDRKIIDCNQTFVEKFGYSVKKITGKDIRLIYESEEEYLHVGEILRKHIGQSHFTHNMNYKTKLGEVFPGESNVAYIHNDKGELIGFVGTIRDVSYRRNVENSLKKLNDKLERKTLELGDTNTALKVLLKKREQDSQELQENINSNYELMITPLLSALKNRSTSSSQRNLLDIIEINLEEIVAPFARKMANPLMRLTPSEIQIAAMVKQGYSNKEMATILRCSKRTVDTHRQHIREKLKLKNEKINLKSFLLNL